MNKAFLRGLVVAAVLLINCTLLSGFIERQMTVPVRECSPRYDNAVGSQRMSAGKMGRASSTPSRRARA